MSATVPGASATVPGAPAAGRRPSAPRVCAAPTPRPSARAWPRSRTPTTRTMPSTSITTLPPAGT